MTTDDKHRRLRWLGQVLKMEQKRIPKKGLRWNPPDKRKQGVFKKMELTWGTAESEAKDRNSWRKRNSCIILNR